MKTTSAQVPSGVRDRRAPIKTRVGSPRRSLHLRLQARRTLEETHFSYRRVLGGWRPAARGRIQAWGDVLRAIVDSIVSDHWRCESELEACVDVAQQLCLLPAPRGGWRRWPDWERYGTTWVDVANDILTCAGLHCGDVESVALLLLDMGRADLGLRMIDVEEYLCPEEIGVSRAHFQAETGNREEGLRALEAIAADESGNEAARQHAWTCIEAMGKRRRGPPSGGEP